MMRYMSQTGYFPISILLLVVLLFVGCAGEYGGNSEANQSGSFTDDLPNEEDPVGETPDPVVDESDDFVVSGIVLDSDNGTPIANAIIIDEDSGDETLTDENGAFLSNFGGGDSSLVLNISAEGYSSNQKTLKDSGDTSLGNFVEMELKSSEEVNLGLLSSLAGSGKKYASAGTNTKLNLVKVDGVTERKLLPGSLSTKDGFLLEPIAAFELFALDENLEKVKDLTGFEYTANIKVPDVLQGEYKNKLDAGDTLVPFWSFKNSLDVWDQDDANKFGNLVLIDNIAYLSVTVSSIGWYGFFLTVENLACVQGLVEDANGNRLGGIEVVAQGLDYQGFSTARTDANGLFSMKMKAGSTIEVFYSFNGEAQSNKVIHLQDYNHDFQGAAENSFCQPTGPSEATSSLYTTYPEFKNHLPPSSDYAAVDTSEFPLILTLQSTVISGMVKDASGQAVANANVGTNLGIGAKSDATGNYEIEVFNAEAGLIKIKASKAINGLTVLDESEIRFNGTEDRLVISDLTLDASLILKYTGKITDPNGLPMKGAEVKIDSGRATLTDENGDYVIYEKRSSLASVKKSKEGGELSSRIFVKGSMKDPVTNNVVLCVGQSLTGGLIEDVAGINTVSISLVMCQELLSSKSRPVANVSGKVLDLNGVALAGVQVFPSLDNRPMQEAKTETDINGKYSFDAPADSGISYDLGILYSLAKNQQLVSTKKNIPVVIAAKETSKAYAFDQQWDIVSEDTATPVLNQKRLVAANDCVFIINNSGAVFWPSDTNTALFTLSAAYYDDVALIINAVAPTANTVSDVITVDDVSLEPPASPTTFSGFVTVNGFLRQGVRVKAIGLAASSVFTNAEGAFSIEILQGQTFEPAFYLGEKILTSSSISELSGGGNIDLGTVETTLSVPQAFITAKKVLNPAGKPLPKSKLVADGFFNLELTARGVFEAPVISFDHSDLVVGTSSTNGNEISVVHKFPASSVGLTEVPYTVQEGSSAKLNGSFFLLVEDKNNAPVIAEIKTSVLKIDKNDGLGIKLEAIAFDPDQDDITYSWTILSPASDGTVVLENADKNVVTLKTVATSAKEIQLELTVKDVSGLFTNQTVLMQVVEAPPEILLFKANPSNTIAAGGTVTIDLDVEDSSGTSSVATIDWGDGTDVEVIDESALALVNGTSTKKQKSSFSFSHTYASAGKFSASFLIVGSNGKFFNAKKSFVVLKSYEKPTLIDKTLTINEDEVGTLDLKTLISNLGLDTAYKFIVISKPNHGQGKLSGSVLEYTPHLNFNGTDQILFKVNDGFADSAEAKISIVVSPVADAPIVPNKKLSAEVPFGGTWEFSSDKLVDPDGPTSFVLKTFGFTGFGTVSVDTTKIVYTASGPAITNKQITNFSFTVSDGVNVSSVVEVELTVLPVTADLILNDITINAFKDTPLQFDIAPFITLPVNKAGLTVEIKNSAVSSFVTINGTVLNITPPAGQTGEFTSGIIIKKLTSAGTSFSNTANLKIKVGGLFSFSSTPILTVDRGKTYSYPVVITNPGSASLSYSAPGLPNWLSFNNGVLSGTPYKNKIGIHNVKLIASGNGHVVEQQFQITVNAVNAVPVVSAIAAQITAQGVAKPISVAFLDADKDDLSFTYTVTSANANVSVGAATGGSTSLNFTLTPISTFVGSSLITVKVKDAQGGEGTQSFTLTVSDEAETHTLTMPTIESVISGSSSTLLTLVDPDIGESYAWSVASSVGTSSLSLSITGNTGKTNTLTLVPVGAYSGTSTGTVTITGGGYTTNTPFNVFVSTLNAAPVLTMPGTQATSEDTGVVLSSISFTDADAGTVDVLSCSLSSPNGSFSLGSTAGLAFTTGDGSNDTDMTFTGFAANINSSLTGISFTPAMNFNGTASLNVTINDKGNTGVGGAKSDTKALHISVAPVNDFPTFTGITSHNMSENGSSSIPITFDDPDIGDTHVWTASSAQANLLVSPGTGSLSGDMLTLTAINGYTGPGTITLNVTDAGSLSTGAAFIVTISAVNDAPQITGSASISVNEDTGHWFSEDFSISDVDAGAATMKATISVNNGTITAGDVSGLSLLMGDGLDDSLLVVTGSQNDIDYLVMDLLYKPNHNFNGADTLMISVNDQGGTGSGGPKVANKVCNITVNAINDHPTVKAPHEIKGLVDHDIPVAGIIVDDIDIPSDSANMQVTLSAVQGNITLTNTTGLANITGNGSTSVTILGVASVLNNSLASMKYHSFSNAKADLICVTVDDLGNFGAGANKKDTNVIIVQLASPVFVNVNVSGGAQDGTSWANAYSDLRIAINNASPMASLWVAQGNYKPDSSGTDRNLSFYINKSLNIYGGFNATETCELDRKPKTYLTVLSGEIQNDGSSSNNSFHVVHFDTSSAECLLSGFTVRDGYADGAGALSKGAGLYSDSSTIRIEDCLFEKNQASYAGGGFTQVGGGSGTIINNCVFEDNKAFGVGGGGLAVLDDYATIRNSVFHNNDALNGSGGAIFNDAVVNVEYSTVVNNHAGVTGGGIYLENGSFASFYGANFFGNTSAGANSFAEGISVTRSFSNSNMEGMALTGSNLDANPLFHNIGNPKGPDNIYGTVDDGLRLLSNSPCVDAGDANFGLQTDITGNARTRIVDIGAYENQSALGGSVYYVNGDIAASGDGLSWANAKKTLQEALAASTVNDEIWVKEGIYAPHMTDRTMSFDIMGQNVFGGFDGSEAYRSERDVSDHETILTGNIGDLNSDYDNSYHVVTLTSVAGLIDGFSIMDGFADGTVDDGNGGGVWTNVSGATVRNCVIYNCAAEKGGGAYIETGNIVSTTFVKCKAFSGNGGGLYLKNSSIVDSSFILCEASSLGGGIYLYGSAGTDEIKACYFAKCQANSGGSAFIDGGEFLKNISVRSESVFEGGGIYIYGGGDVTENFFLFNKSNSSEGGAIANEGGGSTVTGSVYIGNIGGDEYTIFTD